MLREGYYMVWPWSRVIPSCRDRLEDKPLDVIGHQDRICERIKIVLRIIRPILGDQSPGEKLGAVAFLALDGDVEVMPGCILPATKQRDPDSRESR